MVFICRPMEHGWKELMLKAGIAGMRLTKSVSGMRVHSLLGPEVGQLVRSGHPAFVNA